MNKQIKDSNLAILIRYLNGINVRVTLYDAESAKFSIAQLRRQHIIVNTHARDGLNCLFTIAHLFGHLVQYLSYEKYVHLTKEVSKPLPIVANENFRKEFFQYEVEAFRIGKGLMLSCFEMNSEMDSKYSLFMKTDFDHFWHYITTNEKGDIDAFNQLLDEAYLHWNTNKELLEPLPHPKPIQLNRSAFIEVF